MEVHDRLKQVREALGLKQKDMARALSMSASNYHYLERGENKITDRIIKLLVYIYKVDKKWLLTGQGPMFNLKQDSVPDPNRSLRILYKIKSYMTKHSLTLEAFCEDLGLDFPYVKMSFDNQVVPDDILDRIMVVYPELGHEIKNSIVQTNKAKELQEKVFKLEGEVERYRKMIDKLLEGK